MNGQKSHGQFVVIESDPPHIREGSSSSMEDAPLHRSHEKYDLRSQVKSLVMGSDLA